MSQTKRIVVYRLYLKRLMISNYLMLKTRAASVLNGLWVRLNNFYFKNWINTRSNLHVDIMICLYHLYYDMSISYDDKIIIIFYIHKTYLNVRWFRFVRWLHINYIMICLYHLHVYIIIKFILIPDQIYVSNLVWDVKKKWTDVHLFVSVFVPAFMVPRICVSCPGN